jgi:hypothetical protein
MRARGLLGLVAAASLVAGCGGSSRPQSSTVRRRSSATAPAPAAPVDPVLATLGLPPITHASPLPGYLMIADRDNNRLLIVNPGHRIVWRFPAPGEVLTGQQFAGPDDAFASTDQLSIITDEEFSDTIAVVSLSRRPRIVWEYGHRAFRAADPDISRTPTTRICSATG